jgi:TRAP transporter T-component
MKKHTRNYCLRIAVFIALLWLPACSGAIVKSASRMMTGFSASVMKQQDLQLVRDGAPAYLLMVDGLVESHPDNADLLAGAAQIYSAYTSAFVIAEDPERAKILSSKAKDYAFRAASQKCEKFAELRDKPFAEFEPCVDVFEEDDAPLLFLVITCWATWIQAHSSDFNALADLAKVRLLTERMLVIDDEYYYGSPHLAMGVIHTILPPGLGGNPEAGRSEFEKAIEISDGKYLLVHLTFAKQYARAVFDRPLHDRLLKHVMETPVDIVPVLTLQNALAKQQAKELLDNADDFFD